MEHPIKKFDLGTDVEFVAISRKTGKIFPPHAFIDETNAMRKAEKYYAIGKDGDRDTASIELRPGASDSAEILVDNLYELLKIIKDTYHPPGIMYRTGAWVYPEPLGGHFHLSWAPTLTDHLNAKAGMDEYTRIRKVQLAWMRKILSGWRNMSSFLITELFNPYEVESRFNYAVQHRKDFALERSTRPHDHTQAVSEAHIEYRYPPSWMLTPEHAYCFLGGAEVIIRYVMSGARLPHSKWMDTIERMFRDEDAGLSPPNGPNLARAFKVAKSFPDWNTDFVENWG